MADKTRRRAPQFITRFTLAALILSLTAAIGCAPVRQQHPPVTVSDLNRYYSESPQRYSLAEILDYNLAQVMNNSLDVASRLASMAVIIELEGCTPDVLGRLAELLDDPATPVNVRKATVGVLASHDQPGIERYVAAEMADPGDPRLRNTLLDWVTRHPSQAMLDKVVGLWAECDPNDEVAERRCRRAVETIACRTWPDALLEAINADGFTRRTSALKILENRLTPETLRQRLADVAPRSKAMEALTYYATDMNTLPRSDNFYAAVVAYYSDRGALDSIAALVKRWGEQDDYHFAPADIHLLKYLAASGEDIYGRTDLVDRLAKSLAGGLDSEQRTRQLAVLTHLDRADLQRVSILLGWLNEPETRRRLYIAAGRDRADTDSRWGGLIFARGGAAEAILYPPAEKLSDQRYVPSPRMIHDAADCLSWFVCDFDADSDQPASPGREEAITCLKLGLGGLIFTSVDRDYFTATFFNEAGQEVNMGIFQFAM